MEQLGQTHGGFKGQCMFRGPEKNRPDYQAAIVAFLYTILKSLDFIVYSGEPAVVFKHQSDKIRFIFQKFFFAVSVTYNMRIGQIIVKQTDD